MSNYTYTLYMIHLVSTWLEELLILFLMGTETLSSWNPNFIIPLGNVTY